MIKVIDIKEENIMALDNWYDDALMHGIAELTKTFRSGDVGTWF